MDKNKNVNIIFFDGVCVLCSGFADFILRYDQKKTVFLAALQGQKAKELLSESDKENMNSLVLYKNGHLSYSSTAALEVFSLMGGVWKILSWLKIIPSFIREPIYFFIAKNRYKLFGQTESCRLPTPDEKERFLD